MYTLKILIAVVTLLPFSVVSAQNGLLQGDAGDFGTFVEGLVELINNFLIPLIIAFAVLAFIWGVFTYFIAGADDEEKRASGRYLMLYSIIGFVVIVTLWSIIGFVIAGLGLDPTIGPIAPPQALPTFSP